MTEKLITFIERQAGRDIIDAWFILDSAYPLDETMLVDNFGGLTILSDFQRLVSRKLKAGS
jgi:hypothetical protein